MYIDDQSPILGLLRSSIHPSRPHALKESLVRSFSTYPHLVQLYDTHSTHPRTTSFSPLLASQATVPARHRQASLPKAERRNTLLQPSCLRISAPGRSCASMHRSAMCILRLSTEPQCGLQYHRRSYVTSNLKVPPRPSSLSIVFLFTS
jgi:hypothetical protein